MKKVILFATTLIAITQQALARGATKAGYAGLNASKTTSCALGNYFHYGGFSKIILFPLGVFIFSLIFWATFKWIVKDGCNQKTSKKKKR